MPAPQRIVLFGPAIGDDLPAAVLDECIARGVTIRRAADAPAVMVELHHGATALLILDAPRIPRLPELLDAVAAYYPHVLCRQYQHQRQPAGAAMIAHDADPRPPRPARAPSDADDAPPPRWASLNRNSPAVVTEEELAMLIAPLDAET